MTQILTACQAHTAATLLRSGALVAFPTETVYGLGADATSSNAVARIFEAKGRPSFNPLIVHVPDLEAAEKIAVFDDTARQLARAFWPGPMSLVLPLRADAQISDLVSAGLETIAIRIPAHKLAQEILQAAGKPIAAPSANPSGRISPTTAAHVLEGLSGRVDAVIDGGACAVGLESTIFATQPLTLLRAGGVPVEALVELGLIAASRDEDAKLSAPGQMTSHYAPNALMRLNVENVHENEVLLGFGMVDADVNLSTQGCLREAATRLFTDMRSIDRLARGGKSIAVSPIPMEGLGLAINDRLSRAAAPKDS
ncbi:MAG: L-threonylcarbamoyladenylate synthase [Litoreibacter sp.]